MNTNPRRQTITLLAEILSLSPDVRLGQLMAHLGFLGENYFNRGLGDIEDDQLLDVLQKHRAELIARTAAPTASVDPPKAQGT